MHYAGNDWALAQVAGPKAQFARMGIDVIAVTDAGFKPKQVADIETILAQASDYCLNPTDPSPLRQPIKRPPTKGQAGLYG
jgi:ribose transport system substrate-binding protein